MQVSFFRDFLMASVSIRSVKKNFGDVPILHGVDIEIEDGGKAIQ